MQIDLPSNTSLCLDEIVSIKHAKMFGVGVWLDDYCGDEYADFSMIDGVFYERSYFLSLFIQGGNIPYPKGIKKKNMIIKTIKGDEYVKYLFKNGIHLIQEV